MISDFFAKRYGMRGRLWWLWSCQTIAGILCIGLGLANNSFVHTMVVLCFFSFFVQVGTAAAGLANVFPMVHQLSCYRSLCSGGLCNTRSALESI